MADPDDRVILGNRLTIGGKTVRMGFANQHPKWGAGGGLQFELLDDVNPDLFGPVKRIKP